MRPNESYIYLYSLTPSTVFTGVGRVYNTGKYFSQAYGKSVNTAYAKSVNRSILTIWYSFAIADSIEDEATFW